MATTHSMKQIIVADCTGKHNGLLYWLGGRFHTSKSLKKGVSVRIFNDAGRLEEALAGARKTADAVWMGYKITNVRATPL